MAANPLGGDAPSIPRAETSDEQHPVDLTKALEGRFSKELRDKLAEISMLRELGRTMNGEERRSLLQVLRPGDVLVLEHDQKSETVLLVECPRSSQAPVTARRIPVPKPETK